MNTKQWIEKNFGICYRGVRENVVQNPHLHMLTATNPNTLDEASTDHTWRTGPVRLQSSRTRPVDFAGMVHTITDTHNKLYDYKNCLNLYINYIQIEIHFVPKYCCTKRFWIKIRILLLTHHYND